jgi:hypothetical protein
MTSGLLEATVHLYNQSQPLVYHLVGLPCPT